MISGPTGPAQLLGLGASYVSFGSRLWQAWLKSSADYFCDVGRRTFQLSVNPPPPRELMEATLQGLRNYYLDTAMAIPVAIDALGRSIEPVRQKQSANR